MWKTCCICLVVNINHTDDSVVAVVNPVNADKFVKHNTEAGCWKTRCIKPIVDAVGRNDDTTIIKKIIASMLHPPPQEWLELIYVVRHQEKARILTRSKN